MRRQCERQEKVEMIKYAHEGQACSRNTDEHDITYFKDMYPFYRTWIITTNKKLLKPKTDTIMDLRDECLLKRYLIIFQLK